MLLRNALMAGLCVLSASAFAAPESVRFAGTVQEDERTPARFDLHIPSGQSATLKLAGYDLAFATAGSPGNAARTTVVLTRATGEKLHGQVIEDVDHASTSFLYLICDGQTRFISPAPEQPESCVAK